MEDEKDEKLRRPVLENYVLYFSSCLCVSGREIWENFLRHFFKLSITFEVERPSSISESKHSMALFLSNKRRHYDKKKGIM